MILAQELDMPHTEHVCKFILIFLLLISLISFQAKRNIEKAAENMEKIQLERFIRAFQEKKYKYDHYINLLLHL